MKAWCIWCETGGVPSHGYYWIHPECFERMEAIAGQIETVTKYLKGELPRIIANGDKRGRDTVEQFLVDAYDFERRSRNVFKLIKATRQDTPLDQIQFEQSVASDSKRNFVSKKSEPPKLSEEEIKDMKYADYARTHPIYSSKQKTNEAQDKHKVRSEK